MAEENAIRGKGANRMIEEVKLRVLERLKEKLGDDAHQVDLEALINKHASEIEDAVELAVERVSSRISRNVLKEAKKILKKAEEEEEEYFIRFNIHFRIQHMILFTSVILLILTGIPLKFPDVKPLAFFVHMFGGIDNSRLIHRIAASGLILFMVYHMLYVIFHPEGRRDFIMLLPRPKDVQDFIQNIKYFLGLTNERPKFDRFSYIEKFDYWAVYWGCVIMIGSGLLLWFEDISMRFLPKFVIDIAKEAHSDEALLATLAIVIWHFYNVHFNPDRFPGTLLWLHGKISAEEMKEEHPLEYERIMKERAQKMKEEGHGTDK